jgi:hypothetical protein
MIEYRIEITRDGMWPTPWHWRTVKRENDYAQPYVYESRVGSAFTKDRARRKALAAQRSMDCDDVSIVL